MIQAAPPLYISFIIVTYHNPESIAPCLASIREWTHLSFEVIVVDNSEDNATWLSLKSFAGKQPDFPLKCHRPRTNIGFAGGCNIGANIASGRHLMFLNPDTILLNNVAEILGHFMDASNRIAVVGPLIEDPSGGITRTCRNLPNCFNIFLDSSGLDRFLGRYRLLHFSHRETCRVEQVIGACFFVSKEIFERFNGFDERFFIYFEEVDFCKRVLDAGFQVWFRHLGRVRHIGGTSCESDENTAKMTFQLRKSRLQYFYKHFGRLHSFGVNIINRGEGVWRGGIYSVLYLMTRKKNHLEKVKGYIQTIYG
jgi:hypothetical protein